MRGPKPKYPLRYMAVKESRVIQSPAKTFQSYVHRHGYAQGKIFRTRTVEGGLMVTRVS